MDFETKRVEVCDQCKQASCWYGEFMCNESSNAGTQIKTVAELRELGCEHPSNWSDEKMEKVYGDPAPYGYES
jgi:hypothetical protein